MIHSEEESINNSFTPESQDQNHEEHKNKDSKKYAIIDQSIRIQLLRRIISKQATIKDAAKEFGVNFSTAKAILQTYRKEGRIGKKKTRERNKNRQESGENSSPRKIQSMYNLEQPQYMRPISPERKPQAQTIQPIFPVMSSPNLDNAGAQIALALCQRELAQQKLINFQLMMMIQNFKNISQQQVKEEPNIIN
ncbi:unnamed protein product [Paramecium pentaurelia]|uniref:Insertion element IS150 protein InsJ-like helix-turn-helix domain-containing protein n=1 Tax=Paramecium pentaurelia TaxID=43138 RepID=A0A8S1VSG0_9CILI|nr:unnamed protein product [Paramecium pentaurelia]